MKKPRWRGDAVRPRRSRLLVTAALLALVVSAIGAASASASMHKAVWLCKPGLVNDPCKESRTATVVTYSGGLRKETVEKQRNEGSPPIDCFYVYPTVSEQETTNANEVIEPQETQIAIDQASRFSQVCKVYAPMYPQLTLKAINGPPVSKEAEIKAYSGVLNAWIEYLKKFNKGRGFVLIGHSQGSLMLIQLIKEQIDPNPTLRKQLVSALLMGGNVLVPEGQIVGGDFQNVPACEAAQDTHCVIAYSTFLKEPPEGSFFGRADSPLLGEAPPGDQVLCVNPTLLTQNGSAGALLPYASTTPFPGELGLAIPPPEAPTPWVASPGSLTAQCKDENGASWLNVGPATEEPQPQREERETRHETVAETLGPDWGLHLYDVNVALGNLVNTVAIQSRSYGFES
jgi:hypothetical protein